MIRAAAMPPPPSHRRSAFSLVEVVVAIGIFAAGIIAIVALLAPTARNVEDITDTTVATRLSDNITTELNRIGFVAVRDFLAPSNATLDRTIHLVATRDGRRVVRTGADVRSSPAPGSSQSVTLAGQPAENALDDATAPGLAERDRYFLITVTRAATDPADPLFFHRNTAGRTPDASLPVRIRVEWPFYVPAGPAPDPVPGGTTWDDASVKGILSGGDAGDSRGVLVLTTAIRVGG